MATSTSFNFVVNRDDLITEALQLCGVIGDHQSPSSNMLTSCARTLNLLIKAWQADGLQLWLRKTYSVTLTGAESYTFGSGGTGNSERFLRLQYAYRTTSDGEDIPLRILTQEEYKSLSDKDADSSLTAVYYDPQLLLGVLYVWPVDSATTTDTLKVVGQRPMYDFDASTDDADVPQEWYMALAFHLAMTIAPKYGVPKDMLNYLVTQATYWKQQAEDFDVEYPGSLYIKPNSETYR